MAAWRPSPLTCLLHNAAAFVLIFGCQTHIPSGLAAILNATTPLFTVLVAHWATADEKLTTAPPAWSHGSVAALAADVPAAQRGRVRLDLRVPDAHPERACGDPQRNDAAVHRAGRALGDRRRETDPRAPRLRR